MVKESIKKIESWGADVLRVMLYSIQDESILDELVKIGEEYEKTKSIANRKKKVE